MKDQNEAAQKRHVIYRTNAGTTSLISEEKGDKVYSITALGIVIAVGTLRVLIPWHNVVEFTYSMADESARKVIQGW